MKYNDVYTFVTNGLVAKGYGTTDGPAMPLLDPGPPTLKKLQDRSPNAMVFLTVGNGAGLRKEGLFETPFIVVRVIGLQRDYDYAEQLAKDVDDLLLSVDSNTDVGSTRALYITRTGGSPQLVDFDDADRYHFQTTYITEAQR